MIPVLKILIAFGAFATCWLLFAFQPIVTREQAAVFAAAWRVVNGQAAEVIVSLSQGWTSVAVVAALLKPASKGWWLMAVPAVLLAAAAVPLAFRTAQLLGEGFLAEHPAKSEAAPWLAAILAGMLFLPPGGLVESSRFAWFLVSASLWLTLEGRWRERRLEGWLVAAGSAQALALLTQPLVGAWTLPLAPATVLALRHPAAWMAIRAYLVGFGVTLYLFAVGLFLADKLLPFVAAFAGGFLETAAMGAAGLTGPVLWVGVAAAAPAAVAWRERPAAGVAAGLGLFLTFAAAVTSGGAVISPGLIPAVAIPAATWTRGRWRRWLAAGFAAGIAVLAVADHRRTSATAQSRAGDLEQVRQWLAQRPAGEPFHIWGSESPLYGLLHVPPPPLRRQFESAPGDPKLLQTLAASQAQVVVRDLRGGAEQHPAKYPITWRWLEANYAIALRTAEYELWVRRSSP